MIYLSKVKRYISKLVFENEERGDIVKRDIMYPKGLISYPKEGSEGITIGIGKGNHIRYFIPMESNEKEDLKEEDIMVTDGKSKIHFKFKENEVYIKTSKMTFECEEVEFKGSGSIKHNNVVIDSTHKHGFTDGFGDTGEPPHTQDAYTEAVGKAAVK